MAYQHRHFQASANPSGFRAEIEAWLNGQNVSIKNVHGTLSGGNDFHFWITPDTGNDTFSLQYMDALAVFASFSGELDSGRVVPVGWNAGSQLWYLRKL